MKRFVQVMCLCWVAAQGFGQSMVIDLATDKTTSLVFPYPVLHVDRGSKDILVQQVKEPGNILLVKAGVQHFTPTNLSVVTADGSIYSFSLRYDALPAIWVYAIPAQLHASLETMANSIIDNPRTVHGIRDNSWEMRLLVTGIYIKGNTIFYQLHLTNESSIDYDIDFIRFYIRDKTKGRRTAIQENECKPLYLAGNARQVPAHSDVAIVVALEKFTIPGAKYMGIQINERNGGRHLAVRIRNGKIIRAIQLPDLK